LYIHSGKTNRPSIQSNNQITITSNMNKNKNNEVWKSISGFEGEYEISNKGRVRSIKYDKILKLYNNKQNGYT